MSLRLAMKFHEAYERLAPQFGYSTREDTREFDPESTNGKLMLAVCSELEHDEAFRNIVEFGELQTALEEKAEAQRRLAEIIAYCAQEGCDGEPYDTINAIAVGNYSTRGGGAPHCPHVWVEVTVVGEAPGVRRFFCTHCSTSRLEGGA